MGRALRECKYCSRKHERGMEKCPAYGKTCTKCSNQNHFRSVCLKTVTTPRKVQPQKDMQRSKPEIHAVHKDLQPSSEDELWVLAFAEQVNAFSSDKAEFMQPWKSGVSCNPALQLLACWCWNPEYNAKTFYLLQVQSESVGHRHSTCAKPTKQCWVYWRMKLTWW